MLSQECQVIQGGTGDLIMVAGYDHEGNQIVPKLTATAVKREHANVFDPHAQPMSFQGGRIDWWGRDPAWQDRLGFRGKEDVESADGQWTRLDITCDGSRITYRVNGRVANEATGSSLTRGKILLQSEGAEVYYRKVELTPLRQL